MKSKRILNLLILVNIILVGNILFSGCLSNDNDIVYQYDSVDRSDEDRSGSNLRNLMSGGSNVELLKYYPMDSEMIVYYDLESIQQISPELHNGILQDVLSEIDFIDIDENTIRYGSSGASSVILGGDFNQLDLKNKFDEMGYVSYKYLDLVIYQHDYYSICLLNDELLIYSKSEQAVKNAIGASQGKKQSLYYKDSIKVQFDDELLFLVYQNNGDSFNFVKENEDDILATLVSPTDYEIEVESGVRSEIESDFESEAESWSDEFDGEIVDVYRDEMNNWVGKIRINNDNFVQIMTDF